MQFVFIGNDQQTAEMAGLSIRLRWPNATPIVATTAGEGFEIVEEVSPDMVLLHPSFTDMSLPKAIQELRRFSNVPLLTMGQQASEMEVVTALELGADDYVRLPCELTEMMARIWALLRRVAAKTYHEGERPVRSGEMFINPSTYEVFLGDRQIMLTSTEFRVLYLLVKNRGSVVSHQTLERTIWGDQADSSGLVKKYVQRLRQKLGDTAQDSCWVASVHGVGYRFMGPKPEFQENMESAQLVAR